MTTEQSTGAETLLRTLADMGVDHIFASPGSEWAPVWECLANPGLRNNLRYLSSRHEEIAVAMASGYAKATGKLSAVMLHTTVGALHATMSLRGALHENVPMVVFAGESIAFAERPETDFGAHWLGQLADVGGPARLVERCVKWSFAVNSKSVFAATVQRACQLAMAPPQGPVFVSLPFEYLVGAAEMQPPPSAALPIDSTADPRALDQLADMLCEAARPVIVTEEGGRGLAAAERLLAISDLLAIPVAETRVAGYANFPRTHPNHAGFDASEIVREADLVFLVSTTMPWHPPSAGPGPGARVAVLDQNPLRTELPYWGYQVDLCLFGAIEEPLERLLDRLKQRKADNPARAEWAARWAARHGDRVRAWREAALACGAQQPMDPRWVLHELNALLPADAVVVEETITDRAHINHHLDRLLPGRFFGGAIGGLGTRLGTALGVKCARPDQPVILLIGDGAFNYNPALAALGFVQEYGVPIMIVILNNLGFLSQKQGIPRHYPDGWAVRTNTFVGTSITPCPDYAALARIFAAYGETVARPDEVRPALRRGLSALASGSAALIDMRLEPVN